MLFEEIDNMVWRGMEKEIVEWCKMNKAYDKITEDEIQEIWNREDSDGEQVRLNGKYVWETAKRVCNFINSREDLIHITSFREYKEVMVKVMRVIKEAVNVEKKRRQTSKKRLSDETSKRTQRAKSLILDIRHGRLMNKEEIGRRFEEIFGHGSSQEIENATTVEKILERIEETSKREEQLELWEKMRHEEKKTTEENTGLNLFWRKN